MAGIICTVHPTGCIQTATGENLTEAAQIADRWKGYCEDLYRDEEGKGIEQEYWAQEPPPLRSEVAHAVRRTASRKATGPDEVPAELFKAGGETVLDRMHGICVAIWETGEWPLGWTHLHSSPNWLCSYSRFYSRCLVFGMA